MKKFYSFLIAALMLVFMMPSLAGWGQASVGTTLWAETWTGATTATSGSVNATPSANYGHGTTVYNNGTVTYTQSENTVYVRDENLAGGEKPELMLSSGKTWTISGIPTGQATELTLTYKSNNTKSSVTCSTSGASISGSSKPYTITTGGAETIELVFGCTGNTRIDDVSLIVKTAGGTTYNVTFDAGAGSFVGNNDFPNTSNAKAAGTYTLPSATPASGYTFNGWALGENTYQGGASYTVSGDAAFTASYTQNSGGSGGTATLTQSNLGLTGSYTTNTSKTIDGITYVYTDLMKNNDNIQAKASTGTIKNATAYPGNITSVAITHSGTARATTINGSADGTNWTQVATGSGSITADFSGKGYKYFQITRGSSNAAYWEKIDITYEGTSSIATPTFSPAGGTYTTAQNVTITCETEGASIYYTTDGTTPTNTSLQYTSAINVTETTTIKAIAYVGDEASSVASATYVLPLSSMQAIFDKATAIGSTAQTVNITFNNWVVSGKSASYAYVTDGTKGFVITNYSGHGFNAGDVLSGTVSCSLRLNYGYANLQNFSSTVEGLTVVSGGTVETANIDMADLSGVNSGALVHYDNLTCRKNNSNFYLGDGTTEIQVYTTLYSGFSNYLVDGKLYNITGVYQQYNTTKEICPRSAADIEEVIITNPTVTVTPSTINAPFAGVEGTLTLAYENIEEFISFDYYFCDANGNELEGNDPDWIYAEINEESSILSYIIDANDGAARTAYMKVFTYDDNMEEVYAIVTVNQAKYVVDYATLPFAYDGNGTGELPAGFTCYDLDTYSSSPKMQFNTTGDWAILKINERPGILAFDIKGNSFSGGTFKVQTSEDGVTYTDLKTYTSLGNTQSEEFTNLGENVRYIKWIYTTKSSGNVALGNIKLAGYVAPTAYNLTVSLSDNVSAIYVFDANNQNNPLIEDGAAGTVQVLERTSIKISPDVAQGCILASLMVNNVNVIDQLDGSGAYTFTMPSQDVTISATAMVTTTYTLATTIESGRHYIITNGDNRAMGAQGNNNRPAVEISKNGNTATVTSADVREVVINGPDANGYYTIYDAVVPGFLYAASNSSNHLKTEAHLDANNNALWTITFDEVLDNAIITAKGSNSHKLMRYNKNGNGLFSCYEIENDQEDVYLYMKDETTPQYDFYKDIAGYGSNNNVATGWNFIALPVTESFTPDATMISNTYDLYQLNDITWQNYKNDGDNAAPDFSLINGKGYLYANSNNVTLHFSGAINTFTTAGNANQKELSAGWNLIGNPYNIPIYINMPYYKMNAEGSAIETAENIMSVAIPACTGVIVNADENETVTFSTTASKSSNNNRGNIQMALVQSIATRGESNVETIDNAIISFNEGNQLEKFYFGTQNANLYIQQGAEEYAIVSAEAQGEMPVNFKANQSGEYTISINTENVEMNYLHLIDNLTGNDVDLLATPSYTFNAMADDYASRFRLVFSANNAESNSNNFAFISDGQIVLTEQGDAQVYDVMGRMISRHNNVSHITTEGLAAGVYVIRLTNGSETMTQKIVVK